MVGKGGPSEVIKKPSKSGAVGKRSFVEPLPTKRREIKINDYTDHIINQLALVRNRTKGDVVAEAVELYALAYNVARDLSLDMLDVIFSIQDILNDY